MYLAAVIDLFSRQVVGWSMKDHMQTSLVKDALTMARFRRRPVAGLIFHSDRGSQYCSHEFQDALKGWGIRSSMSRKGNCWDNAPTESFWGRLKTASLYGKNSLPDSRPWMPCWTGWPSTIIEDCTRLWVTSVRCNLSNAGMRHSVKRLHKSWAKSYMIQGQVQGSAEPQPAAVRRSI